jgi:beta-glucosidase-like glycosyl hydrolase
MTRATDCMAMAMMAKVHFSYAEAMLPALRARFGAELHSTTSSSSHPESWDLLLIINP